MVTEGPIQVEANEDDAHEADSNTLFTNSNLYIKMDASSSNTSRFNGGYRFNSVDIANGDTVDSVDLEVFVAFSGDDLDADIFANDVDDAADFSTEADVTTRLLGAATTATASWLHTDAPLAFISTNTDGVDLNAVIQEVIDRAGWVSGSDLVMLVAGVDTSSKLCWARAHNVFASSAARITIDFTVGGGPPPGLAARRLLSGTGR